MNDLVKYNNIEEDEIDFLDLLGVLIKYKIMIITLNVLTMLSVVVFAIISIILPSEKSPYPNFYKPYAQVLINEDEKSGNGLSSLLGSSNSLSILTGMSDTGATKMRLAEALLKSKSFLDVIIKEYNLIEYYEIDKYKISMSRKKLIENLGIENDEESGVLKISYKDINPELAKNIVNRMVELLEENYTELDYDKSIIHQKLIEDKIASVRNEIYSLEHQLDSARSIQSNLNNNDLGGFAKKRSNEARINLELSIQQKLLEALTQQYELQKLSDKGKKPTLQILELAEVPDMKAGPSRAMLCIVVTIAAFFLSCLLAFILEAISNIKKDPERLKKLKGQV